MTARTDLAEIIKGEGKGDHIGRAMIEHLRGRERALEPLGWTGREAEWIALVCLHSGVFIRPQFCDYFETDRKQALRVVRALVERRAAIEGDSMMFLGGARLCRISSMAIYRALGVENIRHRQKGPALCSNATAYVARFCSGTSGVELASHRAGEGRVF